MTNTPAATPGTRVAPTHTSKASDKVRVNVMIPTNMLAAARRLADIRGSSYSEVFRQSIYQYLVTELRKEKDAPQLDTVE